MSRSLPSPRAVRTLALRALALTLCVPLGAVALVAAAVAAGILSQGRGLLTFTALAGLYFALPGLQSLRVLRRRRDDRPSGALVDGDGEPALLALIAEECGALGVAPPARVYVSLDHAIWMSRSRRGRTLVVGAPLAFAVSARVLRVAIGEALMRDRSRQSRLLHGWADETLQCAYSWAFLPLAGAPWRALTRATWRCAAAALRVRVLLDDADCARRLGADATTEHLRAGARANAFASYWASAVAPCLDAGFRPPILAGWRQFRGDSAMAEHMSIEFARELQAAPDPDDPLPRCERAWPSSKPLARRPHGHGRVDPRAAHAGGRARGRRAAGHRRVRACARRAGVGSGRRRRLASAPAGAGGWPR